MVRSSIALCFALFAAAPVSAQQDCSRADEREWTVLLYMAADDFSVRVKALKTTPIDAELADIKSAEPGPDGHVVLQVDRKRQGARRFVLRDHELVPCGGSLGETNTGDRNVLASFLRWGRETFPARRVLIVLWGHGLGLGHAFEGKLPDWFRVADCCFDGYDGITTRELAWALDRLRDVHGGPADLVGFDACLMSSLELAHELQGRARFMVAPQTGFSLSGWPYSRVIGRMKQNPGAGPGDLAAGIVRDVHAAYVEADEKRPAGDRKPGDKTRQLVVAAVDVEATRDLVKPLGRLTAELWAALKDPAARSAVMDAFRGASWFVFRRFVDVHDLLTRLEGQALPSAVRKAAAVARERLAGAVTERRRFADGVSRLYGLSIYFPRVTVPLKCEATVLVRDYYALAFPNDTGWGELVKGFPMIVTQECS